MGQHSENWTEKEAMIGQMINQLGSKRHLKRIDPAFIFNNHQIFSDDCV